ncbi:uncharacterized protein [Spinacia oleracea]|uniref:DUF4283 domain-containing protein n=1 Tax=Spinacia oleracea TaxID=3562 RepID=A0ABM3RJ59_SPIOL|nr:uncharacterized protein LOC130470087 [Spinacia oleracea]
MEEESPPPPPTPKDVEMQDDDNERITTNQGKSTTLSRKIVECQKKVLFLIYQTRLRSSWKLTPMGKCLGLNPKQAFMDARVRSMWRIKGSLETIDVGKGIFFYRFSMEEDYERALFGGPWFILDHYIMITTWRPNFRPSINEFDKMTVWVRFAELPVEYYDKDALFSIAKIAGKSIRVNYATDKLTRARYARVCIEIDIQKPLVTKVWVGGD